jgi:hypothetical protein
MSKACTQILGIRGMKLLLMHSRFFYFYVLHSQEADRGWSSEGPRSPVPQLLPVKVISIATPTTHEGHQLLCIAGSIKLDQFTVGRLNLHVYNLLLILSNKGAGL